MTAAAAATVRSGRTVSCARPLDTRPAADNPNPVAHHMIGTATEGGGADYIAIAPHGFATSHLDALCHIFHEGRLYNGYPAETVTAHGATHLGIHHLRVRHRDPGRAARRPGRCAASTPSSRASRSSPRTSRRPRSAAGLRVRAGDALAGAHGALALARRARPVGRRHAGGRPRRLVPPLAPRSATWPRSAATASSDVLPSRVEGVVMPIHTVVIVALGVHLMDNLDLDALAEACAEERRWEFLFTVAPLVLRRGTASPVNPIAVF